jgi:hypothetical protein
MEPTDSERRAKQTAKLVVWLDEKVAVVNGLGFLSKDDRQAFKKQAKSCYGQHVGQTEALCRQINIMRNALGDDLDEFSVRFRKDRTMRDLLDWVDDHDEADRRREAQERLAARNEKEEIVIDAIRELPDDKLEKIIEIFQQVK